MKSIKYHVLSLFKRRDYLWHRDDGMSFLELKGYPSMGKNGALNVRPFRWVNLFLCVA